MWRDVQNEYTATIHDQGFYPLQRSSLPPLFRSAHVPRSLWKAGKRLPQKAISGGSAGWIG